LLRLQLIKNDTVGGFKDLNSRGVNINSI